MSHSQVPTSVLPEASAGFPYSWVGIWKGELSIYNQKGLQQQIPMQLHILPLETPGQYTWTIIYGADLEAGRRAYVLNTIDVEKGIYQIDERNSIAMEAYFFYDKLFSRFSVMDSMLLSSSQLRDGQLIFEIISGNLTPASRTGDTIVDEVEIPAVEAFPIVVMQRAVLQRE